MDVGQKLSELDLRVAKLEKSVQTLSEHALKAELEAQSKPEEKSGESSDHPASA